MDATAEKALWKAYKKSKDKAEIVNAFILMVYDTANKVNVKFPSLDHDQLVSDMQLCLLDSIEGFNPKKGIRFSTYLMRGMYRRAIYTLRKMRGKVMSPIVTEPVQPTNEGRDFAPKIVQAIQLNKCCMPPRQIRLLREIYCGSPCLTMQEIADREGIELEVVVKRVKSLLRKLRQGM